MAKDIVKQVNSIIGNLQKDEIYKSCLECEPDNEWRVFKKYTKKYLDPEWLNVVEETVPCLEAIVREPRKFIQTEEELVETSKAKSVSMGTVKYLAQHTQFIQGIEDGNVIPSKVLNTNREESFQIYENRFIYTLIKRLSNEVRIRYDALQTGANGSEQLEVVVEKDLESEDQITSVRLDGVIKLKGDHIERLDGDNLTPFERLAKIRNSVTAWMSSSFAKVMSKSEPVRPPITRTNVILKNYNFKQALVLWEYLQGYTETGFEVKPVNDNEIMDGDLKTDYGFLVYLNNLFLHELLNEHAPDDAGVGTAPIEPDESKENTINYDDFPKSNIDVEEIKISSVIYDKKQELSKLQIAEITSAIDRAIAQYKLNNVAEKTKQKARLIMEQRKAEKAYRQKQAELRKKERIELEKQARLEIRQKNKEANAKRREEIEKRKIERKIALQEKRKAAEEKEFQLRQAKLDKVAVIRAENEVVEENAFQQKQKLQKDIMEANALRMKLKSEYAKTIDKNIDMLIKDITRLYKK